jgi:hypothetical protein
VQQEHPDHGCGRRDVQPEDPRTGIGPLHRHHAAGELDTRQEDAARHCGDACSSGRKARTNRASVGLPDRTPQVRHHKPQERDRQADAQHQVAQEHPDREGVLDRSAGRMRHHRYAPEVRGVDDQQREGCQHRREQAAHRSTQDRLRRHRIAG